MRRYLIASMFLAAVGLLPASTASATAPLIDPLPRVVIGDESVIQGGGARAYERQQVFLIDDYVDWTHGGTRNAGIKREAWHVYLSDRTGVVNGYNAYGDIPNVAGADREALLGLGALDREFDQYVPSGWGETPEERAERWISLKASRAGERDVGFYAAISSGDLSTTFSVGSLTVYAVPPIGRRPITPPANALEAWEEGAPPGFTGPPGVQAGGMVGWDVGPSLPTSFGFATLKPTDANGKKDFIPSDGGGLDRPVFKVSALLTNSAATTVSEAPGYRLNFFNAAKTHRGFYTVVLGSPKIGPNYPLAGADYAASIMWETPLDLTDMGDDGRIAAFQFGQTTDGRDYEIQFDVIDWAGTVGYFGIKDLVWCFTISSHNCRRATVKLARF